jgi:hypothetical protein
VITAKVEKLSVQTMEELVKPNGFRNRSVAVRHIGWLSGQMKAGRWRANGEPIILDERGRLLDGQHRLYAAIRANLPLETLVVRGVSRDTFPTIGTGRSRRVPDVLSIQEETQCNHLANALGWMFKYEERRMMDDAKGAGFTPDIAVELIRKHPKMRESVKMAYNDYRQNTFARLFPVGAIAFMRCVVEENASGTSESFFDKVFALKPDTVGSGSRALRDWRVRVKRHSKGGGGRAVSAMLMAFIVKAYRADQSGTKIGNLKWSRKGKNVEDFPIFPWDKKSRGVAHRELSGRD